MSNQHEQMINVLKVRLFDTQEKAAFLEAQLKDRERVLMELVRILGIQPDENGTVSLDAIVEEVKALLPKDEAAEDAEEEVELITEA
ncbi:tail fiber assembly chaperone [Escherichia phage FL15]